MEKLLRLDRRREIREAQVEGQGPEVGGEADRQAAARLSSVQITQFQPAGVVQRAPLPGEQTSAPNLDRADLARSGAGRAVDPQVRGAVEAHVGYDLSSARVHDDEHAQKTAASMGARAFTYGSDVYLGRGESAGDQRLMAHELTHVVQQGFGGQPVVQAWRAGEHESQPAEAEAHGVAEAVSQPKKTPEIGANDKEMGDHIAAGMDEANTGPHTADAGIHYAHNFKRYFPQKWKEDMWSGYANPDYFERVGFMHWVLKPGKSASQGIKKWLAGLTIAECNSTVVALEIDAVRAAIGDEKFDQRYSSGAARLQIKPGTEGTPVGPLMTGTESSTTGKAGDLGNRPAQRGEWHYFYNHPKYLLKHPGGAWQGENALCMGEKDGVQMWSGLGASNVTEDGMMDEMVRAYNAPRTDRDEEVLARIKEQNGGTLPKIYDPKGGEFPESVAKGDILSAPEYTINGTTRKGGFVPWAGAKLDAKKVEKLRE